MSIYNNIKYPKAKKAYLPVMVDLPRNVYVLLMDVCTDYERRRKAIESPDKYSIDVIECYIALNVAVDKSLDVIEEGLRKPMLHDLINDFGYNKTSITYIGKRQYYNRKKEVLTALARELHLY